MTSLLRELVSCPKAAWRSRMMVSKPAAASARAQASPITPAPMTMAPVFSVVAKAVADGLPVQGVQAFFLLPLRGDDRFPAATMGNASCRRVGVEAAIAVDAQGGFQGMARVVEPGVNDFAVARAGFLPESGVAFEDDGLEACCGQRAGAGQPDHAGADDDGPCFLCPIRHRHAL